MLRKYLSLMIALMMSLAAFSQGTAPSFSIRGRVVDSTSSKPAEFVTVSLKNAQKQLVKTQLTKADGSFQLEKLPAGNYSVSLVSVGYLTRTVPVSLSPGKALADLGELFIKPSTTQLKAVSLTTDKPIIKQEVDRIAYDLQADPESKVNNVLEMMRKVPMLTVDANDNVQLNGNANYKILINGKPSSMMERSPKDILKSMPASTIQKIEVITTPPAKYDAEGLAGIINIVTNKAIDNGYNGSVNASHRLPVGGPGIGGSLTAKQGRFGISAYGGGSLSNNPSTGFNSNRTSLENSSPTYLAQTNDRESDGRSAYLGTELSYELDSLNLLSGQFNINGNRGDGQSLQHSLLTSSNNGAILQQYDLFNENDNTGAGFDAALNYQKGFKGKKNRLLTFSYRYYGFDNESNNALTVSNQVNYTTPNYRQVNTSKAFEHTLQADYVHPAKKVSMEAGVKAILRSNESDFQYRTQSGSGGFVTDPSKTNTFNNNQYVYSAYNTYQFTAWKAWGVKAGVRVENTVVDADFISTASSVNQNYFNIVPSVSMSRSFKNRSGIMFGFTRRMQRPGINQLNPFVDRSNPSFENAGNPDLRPTNGNQLQFGYNKFKKGNLNVNLMCNWIEGLIFQVSNYDPVTNITRTRYENIGSARAIGFNTNFNYPINQAWSMSVNGRMMHGRAKGISNGKPIKNQGLMYNVNLGTGLKLQKGWRVNANAYLDGGQLTIQDRSNAFVNSSVSVNKDIVKDKLTFSAFANNPFSKYRTNVTHTFGANFDQVSNSQQYFRSSGASLSYRFGKLKDAIKKNKRGITNDDVSN